MEWLNQLNFDKIVLFSLVLTRVSGLMMTAPVYGATEVPTRVRVLFAFAMALLVMPSQWNVAVEDPRNTLNYLVYAGSELLIGMCLGIGITLIFNGMELAGELIGHVGGLMLAETYDPSMDSNVPITSKLLFLISLGIFLCIGGHRLLMAGLLDTFKTIPPGSGFFSKTLSETFITLLVQSYSLGIRAAAPATVALLLSTLILGLISRTVPQLNVLLVGMGLNSMIIFGAMALTIGSAVWVFQDQIEPALTHLLNSLDTPISAQWLS